MYFESFPLIPYDSVGNGDFKLVTNLLKTCCPSIKGKNKHILLFDTYDVKEGRNTRDDCRQTLW